MTFRQQVNHVVTVQGRAGNARAGAVLLTDDNTPIYLDGLDVWPDNALLGTVIEATGLLTEVPAEQSGDPAAGAVSAGRTTPTLQLHNHAWRPLDG